MSCPTRLLGIMQSIIIPCRPNQRLCYSQPCSPRYSRTLTLPLIYLEWRPPYIDLIEAICVADIAQAKESAKGSLTAVLKHMHPIGVLHPHPLNGERALELERPDTIANKELVRLHILQSAFRPEILVKVELPKSHSENSVASQVNQSANPTGFDVYSALTVKLMTSSLNA